MSTETRSPARDLPHPGPSPGPHPAPRRGPRPATAPAPPAGIAGALAADLAERVSGEVRFDDGSRALYATDASNYRQVPIGVVVPRSVEDVIETVAACRRHGAPVLPRGGGTSLAGQCCNVAVVLDCSKYLNRILDLDSGARRARVEPGLVLDELRGAAERHRLTFGPDPATHSRCTLGGMIGNNSCGIHSVMAGKTVDNVEELEVLTYDGLRLRVGATSEAELARLAGEAGRRGEIYRRLRDLRDRYAGLIRERFPQIPRRVSGYNLDQLLPENGCQVARALVGSEGTCATVLAAELRLVDSPPGRALLALGFPDIYRAADRVPEIVSYSPIGLEGLDDRLADAIRRRHFHEEDLRLLPQGGGWLLAEFGGATPEEAAGKARRAMSAMQGGGAVSANLIEDRADQRRLWSIRESALGTASGVGGQRPTWPGWEDSAVAPEKVGAYLRDLRALLDEFGYEGALFGHFGQGCIHVHISFDLETRAGVEAFRRFLERAADLVVGYGGSLSGEHGDGQARGALLPRMYGEELMAAFREFKSIWDPDWKMNPGKVIGAAPPEANLRLGGDYRPWQPETHFAYRDDRGSFARATLRCVGVGECRRLQGGTMCPSFMVTREEKHSTRGRARLLFEMLEGEAIGRRGWRDEEVKEALDLCLSCKGCKGDCPVKVDMATYKAEFLSHYYDGRRRPRTAYALGWIDRWARLAALAPGVANWMTHAPGVGGLMKKVAGVAPERDVPRFAPRTFRAWFAKRRRDEERAGGTRGKVLLWPDTFTNHFHPEIGEAAVEVLEKAGYQVALPEKDICCGRPLYDFGMLERAKRQLRAILEDLREEIRAGTPVVGLEPSCIAVFRDELVNLFPEDEGAKRLAAQALPLADFLAKELGDERFPKLARRAVVHGHCHHKALWTMSGEKRVLDRLGLDYEIPDTGCCGMAGAFGFEAGEHYQVSIACGERALLPAVRNADEETLIVADGFSCREQIFQKTGRRALHLAEVLQMAWRQAT